jgi:very-short-patch-repair endonuclease
VKYVAIATKGRTSMNQDCILTLKCSPAITFAGEQNFIPSIHEISFQNRGDQKLEDIELQISVDPEFAAPYPIRITMLMPGERFVSSDTDFKLNHSYLADLQEAVRGSISITAFCQGNRIASVQEPIELLAYDQWAGQQQLPELLTAFSQPNSNAVAEIIKSASSKLLIEKGEAISGYQNHDRQAVAHQIAAIYCAITEKEIHYTNPPASFTDKGQKIRLSDRIISERLGTCLDISMFFVSCLEQTGLHPLILLEQGHSWVGCWLLEKTLPLPVCDDRQAIRKRVDAGELIAFETTMLTPQSKGSFASALKAGKELLSDENTKRFEFAIDVKRSRGHRIQPLPVRYKTIASLAVEQTTIARPVGIEDVALVPLAPEVVIPSSTIANDKKGDRIEQWKSNLLDLTLRNRQLNFKQSKQTIPIYYPEPAHIEDLLADGKGLKVKSLPELMTGSEIRSNTEQLRKTATSHKEDIAREAFNKGELLAELTGIELDSRMTEIFRSARTAQEEGGANTLYLVIGMLQWVEKTDINRLLLAPLIMVPVTLERKAIRSGFTLKRHDDEAIVNPTLIQLLEQQFSLRIEGITGAIELPSDDSGVDVEKIWAGFRNAVIDLPGFEVKPDVCLGMFTFTKYLMWKDLNDRIDDILKSPLIKHLANREQTEKITVGMLPKEQELDSLRQPYDLFIPDNCDSSQLAAVSAAADGMNFVLEGPPGTGKSQTITNIIADKLARGQTVLFVSEKIAALSVVHERLKKLGLGPFLLELHSAKASKSAVLAQLDQSLKSAARYTINEWQIEADRVAMLRNNLNDYVRTIHTRHTNGLSVYDALSLLISKREWKPCGFEWQHADEHTVEQVENLRMMSRRLGIIGSLITNLDFGLLKSIRCFDWSPEWQSELLSYADAGVKKAQILETEALSVINILRIDFPIRTSFEYQCLDLLCGVLCKVLPNYDGLLENSDLAKTKLFLTELAIHGRKRNELAKPLQNDFRNDLFNTNVDELIELWSSAENHWWLPRLLKKKQIARVLRSYNKKNKMTPLATIPSLLDLLKNIKNEDTFLNRSASEAQILLRSTWQDTATDWDAVTNAIEWLNEFSETTIMLCNEELERLISLRKSLNELLTNSADLIKPSGSNGTMMTKYRISHTEFKTIISKIDSLCNKAEIPANNQDLSLLTDLRDQYSYWMKHGQYLKDWCLWNDLLKQANAAGLSNLIEILENRKIAYDLTADYFWFSYADWWIGKIVNSSQILKHFTSADHEQQILEFRERDDKFTTLTREYIFAKLAGRIPTSQMPPPGTPLGILRRELQKKSRHMPVRKLLSTLAGVLPELTPCLLMSPLSVAQYLDTSDSQFDLVIFDEASQIPTWDAVGTIARGKQVIVVGDPKQLPPTNFFNKVSSSEYNADAEVEELESILDECIGSSLPTHTLKWHYRSQRESLIAFSNYRYYQSSLITFPSPVTPDNGVVYHHVNGVYQRSGARTNRQEADAIVEHIRLHFNTAETQNQSIGVVTFSQAQQELIEDLLDAARNQDPVLDIKISTQINEPVFIKNLENVQGDERDVILFSICYGPDENGRVYMNFGPLNQNGGHRRLNVAITRAKCQIHIYATLRPEQIDVSKTRANGVIDLKLYLEYASKGSAAFLSHAAPTGKLPESLFEKQVMEFLQSKGWEVHPQVGCSGYRIDFGIVDPRNPGRYLMAIECDGASYHSAATARDRDKSRQMVLERLGWKVHRIWSTQWWTNPTREQNRVLEALELAFTSVPLLNQELVQSGIPTESIVTAATDEQTPLGNIGLLNNTQYRNCTDSGYSTSVSNMPQYIQAQLSKGDREKFLLSTEYENLMRSIDLTIETEGPVSNFTIKRRVCTAYGFDRIGPKMADYLNELIGKVDRPTTEEINRVFYWPASCNIHKWRQYREAGERSLQDIPQEEIANMAEIQLKNLCVAEESVIAREVATTLGISRVTKLIEDRIIQAVKLLVAQGRVVAVQGGLKVIDN